MITPAPESQFAMYASEAMGHFTIAGGASGAAPMLILGDDSPFSISAQFDTGLVLNTPAGLRLMDPGDDWLPPIYFGPGNDKYIMADPPEAAGLVLAHPGSTRLFNPQPERPHERLYFGLDDQTFLERRTDGSLNGLMLRDAFGVRIMAPMDGSVDNPMLYFGPTDLCAIGISDMGLGMIFTDPDGFTFEGGNVGLGISGSDHRQGEGQG
jgi:hypothetical protein